ncbi:Protein N-acetyltransferase, RimJ/RimL family [Izhakiella capsodis]|uniref:Protein N-acetyltransferase, RimJ/RimL family n=1 Tax=Izhakiella capsodis TaxID=1367852 RepID=A0A1I4WJH0_9GAMM|nr:GNAT family N-acetyltransferase [Izhakiella capsodis]SFN13376.1 Protein N-acetyltransferase, RimJ/RimL family [Izhakiella capsodis]
MRLETDRLLITLLKPENWPLFLRVHQDEQCMAWVSAIPDDEELQKRFSECLLPWFFTSDHMLCLVVRQKKTGEAIGLLGATAEGYPYCQVEIGYAFLSQFHGQGFGSEALAPLCEYLLHHCGFHKLTAHVVEGNWSSRRILEKNSFLLEGVLRDNRLLRGRWKNDWVFVRLR